MDRAYSFSTRLFGVAILLLGVAMIAVTLSRGGGALAIGVVVGVLFALLGVGRLWLSRDTPTRGQRR